MYINLDVVMRLMQIGLVIAGIGVLVSLAMLFKNLMATMKALTGTLDLLQRDLAKLEGPLNTVDELSSTVSEIQHSAKRAANTAIDTFQTSSAHFMNWVDSKTEINRNKPKQNTEKTEEPKAEFKPVQSEKAPEHKPAPVEQLEVKTETIETEAGPIEMVEIEKSVPDGSAEKASDTKTSSDSEVPSEK